MFIQAVLITFIVIIIFAVIFLVGANQALTTKQAAIITVMTAIIFCAALALIIIPAVQNAADPNLNNPEYHYYISIRDASNCTMENDTYCMSRGGCVHAYASCQERQCPGSVP